MRIIHATAIELAILCDSKNRAYGDSIHTAAAMLALQHPNGLRPDQYYDALIDARIFEKQLRHANQTDAGTADPHGEDPRKDRAGYALLALHHAENLPREHEPCPGSARRPDAHDQSKAQPDSAAQPKSAPTTTSAAATRPETKSPSPSASCESTSAPASTSTSSAPAPSAPAAASPSAEGPPSDDASIQRMIAAIAVSDHDCPEIHQPAPIEWVRECE